jgi:hypothetical protein
MYMRMAAIAAVMRKVMIVVTMTRPARRALFMLAMAEAMEQNTSGTTTQNMRLMNTVPMGSRAVAPGQTAPTTQPAAMPTSIQMMNQ